MLLLAILQGVEARTIQPVLSCPEHCENRLLITPGFHQGFPQAGGQWKTGVLALQVAAHPWWIHFFPSLLGLPQTRTRPQLSVLLLGKPCQASGRLCLWKLPSGPRPQQGTYSHAGDTCHPCCAQSSVGDEGFDPTGWGPVVAENLRIL